MNTATPFGGWPVAVNPQLPEHAGTLFETYEFSNGMPSRIMTRPEFDAEFGQTLRIQLEQARSTRDLNANRCDATFASLTKKQS